MTFKDIDSNLKAIINYIDGPSRIIAGPGSGKTRIIVLKYINLILNQNVDPSRILLLTFSNKAADELKKRVINNSQIADLNLNTNQFKISTIHSFCKSVIDEYRSYLKSAFYPTAILNDISQGSFVLSFIEDYSTSSKVAACNKVFNEIVPFFNKITDENLDSQVVYSHLRAKLLKSFEVYKKEPSKEIERYIKSLVDSINLSTLYPIYIEFLKQKLLIDFSNIQRFLLNELETNQDLLLELQGKIDYVLVDEYQDTSYLQSKIILKLCHPNYRITVVGDDDQSLYRFRGATVYNFLNLQNEIPKKLKDFYLITNFRSDKEIVIASQSLIVHNSPHRIPNKVIKPSSKDQGICGFFETINSSEEASMIVDIIEELRIKKRIRSYSEICILFRSVLSESQPLVSELMKRRIPYHVVGYDKLETSKPLVYFTSLWNYCSGFNPDINLYNNPFIPLNNKEIEILYRINFDLTNLNKYKSQFDNKESFRFLQSLIKIKSELKEKVIKSNISFFYRILIENSYFKEMVSQNHSPFLSDLAYLSNIVSDFDISYQRTDPYLLSQLFSTITLKGDITDSEYDLSEGQINVMTIHQSKGLEFPIVFLPNQIKKKEHQDPFENLNDLFHYEVSDTKQINEIDERKVFYVGLTRGKSAVFLSYPLYVPWGNREKRTSKSRYIEELGIRQLETLDKIKKIISLNLGENKSEIPVEINEKLILNYSKLHTYFECPRKYNLLYNLKLATVLQGQITFGLTLHSCLDVIHKNFIEDGTRHYTEKEVQKIVNENWIDITYKKRETKQLKETAIRYILAYIIKNQSRFDSIYKSEDKFSLYFPNGNFVLNGVIDLILKDKDNFTIIDFKASDIEKTYYRDQMILYNYAFKKIYKGSSKTKLLLYSIRDNNMEEVVITQDELDKFEIKLFSAIQDIRDNKFNENKGDHCKECPYLHLCF